MRTLYFLEPGQKLNDLKPTERKRGLLVTKHEWEKFGEHLVRKQRLAEAAEREKEEMEHRKMMSKEMAKTWDNTIINIRRRRIENRRKQIASIETDRRKRFLEMRKEEEDNKKKIVEEARRLLRQEKDSTKSLISALRCSEVLREREEQIKFDKKLKEIEDEREKIYAAKLKADAEEYQLEIQREKEEKWKKMAELNKEVRKAMAENVKAKVEREKIEIELEKLDNIRVVEEMKAIEERERIDREEKKQMIMKDIIDNRRMIAEHEAECKLEQEEEEAAIHIHAETKKRIAKIKKQREKEEAIANQVRREKISASVAAEAADRESEENRIIAKAVAEREAKEQEMLEKKKAYQKQLVEEIKEERKRHLKLEEEKKYREKELVKLSIMQRLKNVEVNAEFDEQIRQSKKEYIKGNRETWDRQNEERKAVKAAERQEDIDAVARAVECWKVEDKNFLEYADTVIEESKEKNRPLYPMLKYIEKFKHDVGITRNAKQHPMFISKVPINNKFIQCPGAKKKQSNIWPNENDRNNKRPSNILE